MDSCLRHCIWNKLWQSGRLSQGYLLRICLQWLPTPGLLVSAIKHHLDYRRCIPKNRWLCIVAHFHPRAGCAFLPLLCIKATSTSIMNIRNQSPLQLPTMQDLKWTTLSWRWFCPWCIPYVQSYAKQMIGVSPARPGSWFVTNSEIEVCWTRKLLPRQIASLAHFHIEIGFGQGNGGSSCVAGGIDTHIAILHDISHQKDILYLVSNLPAVSECQRPNCETW